jgi:hypothetical protein
VLFVSRLFYCSFVGFTFVSCVRVVVVSEERREHEDSDGVEGGDGFDFGGKNCGVWDTRWSLCTCAHFLM